MEVRLCTVLVIVLQPRFTHSAHVSGTITDDITLFYRKLLVAPSLRATIEFNISYRQSSMDGNYPLMGIYIEYPTINIGEGCSRITYGQLRNENLHPYLRLGRYRTTICALSASDTVSCTGRVRIQDFKPRNFYLTFGFLCNSENINSLQNLTYNISFTFQSNDTNRCINYSEKFHTKVCSRNYFQTSLPNLIGDESLSEILEYFDLYKAYETASIFDGRCYQHLEEIACYTIFPKCDPFTKQVIHPCREMCLVAKEACLQKMLFQAKKLVSKFSWHGDFLPKGSNVINCDYLPSLHDNIPCFYKPVTCESPPDVTNSTRLLNTTLSAA